jgi:general secretion pathway protein I
MAFIPLLSKVRSLKSGHFCSGFTLMEVLVALSIMAIVIMAIFRLHSQTIDMARDSDFWVTAPLLAGGKMAEIETRFPDVAPAGQGDFGDAHPGYTWQATVAEVASETLGNVAEDLKQIDVTVTFDEGKRTFNLRGYRFVR